MEPEKKTNSIRSFIEQKLLKQNYFGHQCYGNMARVITDHDFNSVHWVQPGTSSLTGDQRKARVSDHGNWYAL